jgi:mannose-6-phosphate isomerase
MDRNQGNHLFKERMSVNMQREPLFLDPVFKERIWGGTALRTKFNYCIPSDKTGECWAISAHSHGQSVVRAGAYTGTTLGELWQNHRELFGNAQGETFPLLTKILDANADLSVQVHPNDEYAGKYENGELGKTECWYIIDCAPDAELIYGHTAESREQLETMIQAGQWDQLLRRVKIKPGDFFFVPSGTIHALGAGTLVLETQQSSDTTYRVYDYDRKDDKGNTRELHIDKALAVTQIPHVDPSFEIEGIEQANGLKISNFIESPFFSVQKWELHGQSTAISQDADFLLFSVIEGSGEMVAGEQAYAFCKGDHFILPHGFGKYVVRGDAVLIVAHP